MRTATLLSLAIALHGSSADTGALDKIQHATLGASISLACDAHDVKPAVKVCLVLIAAVGKELLDRHADPRDAMATAAGASFCWTWRF